MFINSESKNQVLKKNCLKKSCWILKGETQMPKCKAQNLTYTVYFQRCLNLTGQSWQPKYFTKHKIQTKHLRTQKEETTVWPDGTANHGDPSFYLLVCSKSSLPILKAFVWLFFFLIWLRYLFTLSANTHHHPSSYSYLWLYITIFD